MTNGNAEETTFSKIVPYFDSIKKNVNFEQIADKLVASSLLLPDEFHHIASIPLNSDKVAHYLDTILPKRESVTFLEVLRQANYAWISDEILPAKQLPFALNGRKEKKRTSTVPRRAVIKKAKSVTDDDEVDASVIEAAGVPMDEDVCGNRAMEKASVPATPSLTVNTNNNTTLTKIDKSSESMFFLCRLRNLVLIFFILL
jgi:hypothetical protein